MRWGWGRMRGPNTVRSWKKGALDTVATSAKKVRTSTPHVTKINQLLWALGSALPNESTAGNIVHGGRVATLEPGPCNVSGNYQIRLRREQRRQREQDHRIQPGQAQLKQQKRCRRSARPRRP